MHSSDSEALRRRAVATAVALATDTPLMPQRYERRLLARYEQGELTIDQVVTLLSSSVYQILYHSRAVAPFSETELETLLARARAFNGQHNITGLLLYSNGLFVQAFEGPEAPMRALYARIQADPRHTQVVTVNEGPEPARRFPDWQMGFGHVGPEQVDEALAAMHAELPVPNSDTLRLRTLLETFGVAETHGGKL